VVFLEKRLLYSRRGPVPAEEYTVPIGVADVKRPGRDATVVAYAQGVHLALQAARQLARDEVEVEVIDVRTLKPLDLETIADSVRRTGRLVVVSEGARAGGFASEVVARVVDEGSGSQSCRARARPACSCPTTRSPRREAGSPAASAPSRRSASTASSRGPRSSATCASSRASTGSRAARSVTRPASTPSRPRGS